MPDKGLRVCHLSLEGRVGSGSLRVSDCELLRVRPPRWRLETDAVWSGIAPRFY